MPLLEVLPFVRFPVISADPARVPTETTPARHPDGVAIQLDGGHVGGEGPGSDKLELVERQVCTPDSQPFCCQPEDVPGVDLRVKDAVVAVRATDDVAVDVVSEGGENRRRNAREESTDVQLGDATGGERLESRHPARRAGPGADFQVSRVRIIRQLLDEVVRESFCRGDRPEPVLLESMVATDAPAGAEEDLALTLFDRGDDVLAGQVRPEVRVVGVEGAGGDQD